MVSSFKVPEDRMVPTSSPTMGVARAMVTMQVIATAPIKIRDLRDMAIASNKNADFLRTRLIWTASALTYRRDVCPTERSHQGQKRPVGSVSPSRLYLSMNREGLVTK